MVQPLEGLCRWALRGLYAIRFPWPDGAQTGRPGMMALRNQGLKLRNRIVWHFGHGLHSTRRLSGRYETINWWMESDDYTWYTMPTEQRKLVMKKLISIGSIVFSLALVFALVWGSAIAAFYSEVTQENVASIPRLPSVEDDHLGDDDDQDGNGGDGDTPTPTDNDGTDSDGIDTPTPTDNDGTDSDGVDTPTPTDNDGTDSDGIDTPASDGVTLPQSKDGDVKELVVTTPLVTVRGDGNPSPVTGVTVQKAEALPDLMSKSALQSDSVEVFDTGASYRILTRYGSAAEIVLADYLATGVEGITFALKSCDDSRGDYYASAIVENGKLVLGSNTLGHVHGPSTQVETVCTVTGSREGVSEDREFRLYTVSDRTPLPMLSGSLTVEESRSSAIDVRITVPGGSLGYLRMGWRKAGDLPSFGVVSGVTDGMVLTLPGLEAGTEYEIRAYWMTAQGFDLYRNTNSGSAGELIAEGSPDSKWVRNLSGGGLGKSATTTLSTAPEPTIVPTPSPTPDPTPVPTPEATLAPPTRPTPVYDDEDTDDDGFDTPETDNDGFDTEANTDHDGIDTPETDNDGFDTEANTDHDGIDTPTPTDGIDTPPVTDGIDTPPVTDGIDTPLSPTASTLPLRPTASTLPLRPTA